LDNCEYLVNLPKFKTHDLTLLTGAIKNLFGLVSGTYKTELHKKFFEKDDFANILVDIFQEAKPALTIVDGIVAMEGDGPATSGKLRNLNLLFAGADCVALDSILALIMGVDPLSVTTTKEAVSRGLGEADMNSISILGESLSDVGGKPFLLPTTSTIRKSIPKPVIKFAKKFIRYLPFVVHANCIRCSACVQACPSKIISLKDNHIHFDYSKCIFCFCCQEACPASAIKVKKSLLAKMIGL
jgi:ferredoxin